MSDITPPPAGPGPDMPGPDMPDPDMMAAEYALGLLDGDDRAAATRRMLSDPEFAADVARWQAHFGLLFDRWPDAAPPANGLARIDAALDPAPAPPPAAANDDDRSGLWKGIAGLSSLVAAALVGVIVLRPAPTPPAPQIVRTAPGPILVAAIAPTTKGAPIAAVYDLQSGALRVSAARLADADHSAELWVIGTDDPVPHSLGVLRAGAKTDVAVAGADRPRIMAGATLAITVEAPGGSPDGKPKGPVVAAGALTQI